MALNNKPIVLDIDKRFNRLLLGKSLDTTGARSYTMKILYSNLALNLTGLTVQVGGTKPDGFGVLSNCKVIDSTKGIIEVDLTTQMLATPGVLKLEIIFLKGDIRLSSIPFEVEVIKSVTNYNQVVSSNDFLVFQDELKKIRAQMDAAVDKINNRYASTEQKANKLIDAMQHTVDGTIANEVYNNTYETIEGTNIKCNTKFAGYTKDFIIEGRTFHNVLKQTTDWTISSDKSLAYLNIDLKLFKSKTKYTVFIEDCSKVEDYIVFAVDPLFNEYHISNKQVVTTLTTIPTKCHLHVYSKNGEHLTEDDVNKIKIVIMEGDWSNKDISYFEGIKSVGDLNNNKVNILSNGKNLFFGDIQRGSIAADGSETRWIEYFTSINYFQVKPSTKYSASFKYNNITRNERARISYYDINKNFISTVENGAISPFNATYARVTPSSLTTTATSIDISLVSDIQFEEGEITTYEPYISDKKEISLPIEDGLKSLPNGVCDIIYENNSGVVLEQRIKKSLLNGSENWIKHLENEKYISFYKATEDAKANINSNAIISDKFISATYSEYTSLQFESISLNNSDSKLILISILKDKLETKDTAGFKKWLQANPTTVYYQLSKPIYHKIKEFKNLNLKLYNEQSYVRSDNKIKPVIKFGYSSTLRSSVDNNAESIFNINEIIKNLGPEDIGAVSRKGDTVTGTLKFKSVGNEIEIQSFAKSDQARGVVYKNSTDTAITGMIGSLMNKDNVTKMFMGATDSPWNGVNSLSIDKTGAYFDNKRLLSTNDLSNGKGQGIPIIGADSVMEVGSMIDFHANSSVKDYSVRVEVDSNSLFKLQGCNGLIVNNKKVQLEPDTTPLWQGCYYMSTGQNITLSKPIDDCQNGIILVWGDFDAPSTQTNCNYTTFIIPKNAGINNSGNYLCSIPYSENVGWIIKAVSIKGNTILGNSNDNQTGWNDVVLYKVLEY